MKYFEFNDCDYYALIAAKNEEDAIELYAEEIAEIDVLPDEITKTQAKKVIENCQSDDIEKKEALAYLEKVTSEPFTVLIDAEFM